MAKLHGGQQAVKQVAYLWAKSLGGEAGAKILVSMGLVDMAVEYASDVSDFELAFDLANKYAKSKLAEVYHKHALTLEDRGMFLEAEEEFIKVCDQRGKFESQPS